MQCRMYEMHQYLNRQGGQTVDYSVEYLLEATTQ
jgi:anaerobic ribonucleoside-triphosphate reductase